MRPPGAMTADLFWTSAAMVEGVVLIPARCVPSKFNVTASPAARATVPMRATTTPLLRTFGANRAI